MTSKRHRPWARKLSRDWQRAGVLTTCEVRFEGCWGTYGLAPAHSKDRDEILTEEDFREVVAACEFCHRQLDHKMSKEARLEKVKDIIEARNEFIAA